MQVIYVNGMFVAQFPYTSREMCKQAGFVYDKLMPRNWATKDLNTALGLERWFAKSALDEALRRVNLQDANIHKSALVEASGDIEIPAPEGLEYLPFQRAGIEYALRIFGDLT